MHKFVAAWLGTFGGIKGGSKGGTNSRALWAGAYYEFDALDQNRQPAKVSRQVAWLLGTDEGAAAAAAVGGQKVSEKVSDFHCGYPGDFLSFKAAYLSEFHHHGCTLLENPFVEVRIATSQQTHCQPKQPHDKLPHVQNQYSTGHIMPSCTIAGCGR